MHEPTTELAYLEYDRGIVASVQHPVITETPWVLYLNGREVLTFMCSPLRLHCLALGFLLSEGLIDGLADIHTLKVHLDEHQIWLLYPDAQINEQRTVATCEQAVGSIDVRLTKATPALPARRVLTSGCGGGITFDTLAGERPPLHSDLTLTAQQIQTLMRDMNHAAGLYRLARGVHTSALSDGASLSVLAEDVGRHNTLDKLRGECMLRGIATADHVLLSSGRISSEMITKAYKMGVPIVASRTSPTVASVHLAQRWNITLVGYVRGPRLRVYSHPWRIIFSPELAPVDAE